MKQVSSELPILTIACRMVYPCLKRLHVWNVAETTWFGLCGCDRYRVTWMESDGETRGVTADTLSECVAFVEETLAELQGCEQEYDLGISG